MSGDKTKKKQGKLIRNILAQPFKQHWPEITKEEAQGLICELKKSLPLVKIPKVDKLPWNKMRNLSKTERRQKIEQMKQQRFPESIEAHKTAIKLRKNLLCLGVNDVCRAVENETETIISCLIDSDVTPKFIVKHVIQLACNAEIPVLITPNLKSVTKETLGFSCLSMGLKKSAVEDEAKIFSETSEIISNLWERVKSKMLTQMPQEEISGETDEPDLSKPIVSSLVTVAEAEVPSKTLNYPSVESLHLHRKSNDYRVFCPSGMAQTGESDSESEFTQGNITIDLDSENMYRTDINTPKTRYYIPPKINQVQSNPKKKRKIKR